MFIPNTKQVQVFEEAIRWWNSPRQVFEYAGYAGTGKSTILMYIIQALGLGLHEVAPMSFMGQPSIVMRMKGLRNAKTIHSWNYEAVEDIMIDQYGNPVMDTYLNRPKMKTYFLPKEIPPGIRLIIVDEAGAVPMYLKKDIERHKIKVIATGDIGQLRPIGDEPAYLYDKDIIILDEPMRQADTSGILYLATRARQGLPIHYGNYGDAIVVDQDEFNDNILMASDVVLCGKNKTRDSLNNRVRHDILGYNSMFPVRGEKLICRKNNWTIANDGINLANGLNGIVTNSPGMDRFDGKTFTIDFLPNILDTPFTNISVDYDYLTSNVERRNMLKNSKYSVGEKFEYAYGTTVHLSQGSEYNQGTFIEEILNMQYHKNFLYTGITRFRNAMVLVKYKRRYY